MRAAREVESRPGYVELQRRYRVTGTQDVRSQVLLLGYQLDPERLEPGGAPRGRIAKAVHPRRPGLRLRLTPQGHILYWA